MFEHEAVTSVGVIKRCGAGIKVVTFPRWDLDEGEVELSTEKSIANDIVVVLNDVTEELTENGTDSIRNSLIEGCRNDVPK
jgi:hypothetical protein